MKLLDQSTTLRTLEISRELAGDGASPDDVFAVHGDRPEQLVALSFEEAAWLYEALGRALKAREKTDVRARGCVFEVTRDGGCWHYYDLGSCIKCGSSSLWNDTAAPLPLARKLTLLP